MDPFAALADPVRRDLVRTLAAGPSRVADLAAGRDISRPAVSRHLRLLSEAGLVAADDRGRERHYRFLPGGLVDVDTFLARVRTPPRFDEHVLDGLDLEVRRTVRERSTSATRHTTAPSTEETG